MTARRSKNNGDFWLTLRVGIVYGVCRVVGWLPSWFLYHVLADVIYFLLYRVVRYRVAVTRDNLRRAFPQKTAQELRRTERGFYHHLAELFVDTIDLTGLSVKALRRRFVIRDEEEFRDAVRGKDWIIAAAHYGSWEYLSYALAESPGRELLGVYHPLHSKVADGFMRKTRARMGMTPVPMGLLLRHVLANRKNGVGMSLGLIADQSPPGIKIDHWYDFFGRPTAFFDGPEVMAERFAMPVYFVNVTKLRRAHYEASMEMIYDGTERLEPHELTERYVRRLEEMIRRQPEIWMWSHRRWKHQPR